LNAINHLTALIYFIFFLQKKPFNEEDNVQSADHYYKINPFRKILINLSVSYIRAEKIFLTLYLFQMYI